MMKGYGQRMSRGFWVAVWCVALSGWMAPVWAQGTAWNGAVQSGSGQAVAGATVELSGAGRIRTATTGADGKFSFEALAAGQYSLIVRVAGRAATAATTVELPGAPGFVTVTD